MKRRTFLTSTAAASGLLTSTAGCLSSADGGGSNLMLGSLADRPAVDSEFFQRRSSVQRVFLEATTGVKYGITDSTTDWVRLPVGGAVEAPQTSELAAGELAVGFDDESGAFELRAKDASGTEYQATVSGQRLSPIPASGVSRWEFEQDVVDSWGGNDATDNTSTGYVTGAAVGTYAKEFNDNSNFVTVPADSTIDGLDPISVAAWINLDSPLSGGSTQGFSIVNKELEFSFENNSGNVADGSQIGVGVFGDRLRTVKDSWNAGQWYQVVFTFDSGAGEFDIYVDGSLDNSKTPTDSIESSTNDLEIGGRDFSSLYLDGQLDDVRIYNKALTDTEVSDLYSTGSI